MTLDLISRQKDDLMADQSVLNNQNENAYSKQAQVLTLKVKEYRVKCKELEAHLLEIENKRLEQRKQIEELSLAENKAYHFLTLVRQKSTS